MRAVWSARRCGLPGDRRESGWQSSPRLRDLHKWREAVSYSPKRVRAVAGQDEIAEGVFVIDADRLVAELKRAFHEVLIILVGGQLDTGESLLAQGVGDASQHFSKWSRVVERLARPKDEIPSATCIGLDSWSATDLDHRADSALRICGSMLVA